MKKLFIDEYGELKPLPIGVAVVILVVGFVTFLALTPFTIVGSGHRGVVVNVGKVQDEILEEGFHFINPIASVTEINVQTQKVEAQATAASKDLQTVTAVVAVNYHLDPKTVNKLYQEIGMDFESRIISPSIQEAVKSATAKFTAEELITKRSEVGADIQASLTTRLNSKYMIVELVSIVNFDFSPSFNEAIEAKVTAEQNALASKNKLEQIKYEAEQRIVQAEAEAEAIAIQASAINSQGGADYVNLKAVEKWSGVLPTYMTGDSIPFINLTK